VLYFPDKSAQENEQFSAMLDEINNHLVYVLTEKLGWHDAVNPEMSVGGGHVVIRFENDGQRLVFRVPKFGIMQLKRNMMAYRYLGHLDIIPEKVYHDGKCIIELHADGGPFSSKVSDAVLGRMASQLSVMHGIQTNGFGPLNFDLQGGYPSAAAYFQDRAPLALDWAEMDLTSIQTDALTAALAQSATVPDELQSAPTFLGHGDLWRNNILVSQDGFKIVDWDRLGAYPIERDLAFLWVAGLCASQRALFYRVYAKTVNRSLLRWFAVRHILQDGSLRLSKKLKKIQEIDLLMHE